MFLRNTREEEEESSFSLDHSPVVFIWCRWSTLVSRKTFECGGRVTPLELLSVISFAGTSMDRVWIYFMWQCLGLFIASLMVCFIRFYVWLLVYSRYGFLSESTWPNRIMKTFWPDGTPYDPANPDPPEHLVKYDEVGLRWDEWRKSSRDCVGFLIELFVWKHVYHRAGM